MGPLGFQPDVFDDPPGHPGYSPLRKIILVTWKEGRSARTLKSAAGVEEALKGGEIMVEEPGGGGEHAHADLAGGATVAFSNRAAGVSGPVLVMVRTDERFRPEGSPSAPNRGHHSRSR